MYDVIIVGARCAGAATAMLLAHRGYRVLLVDRATFPSDIPQGHFIYRHGPQRLQRWGLLARVEASGCPAVSSVVSDLGDGPLQADDLYADGVAMGYAPRRSVLDAILLQAAVTAGAELRQGVVVEGFTFEGERLSGIRARTRSGLSFTERAGVTVGADGRNSRLARTVQPPTTEAHPAVSCWYWSYWSGVPRLGLGIYSRPGRFVFTFPTNDGLTGLVVSFPIGELERVQRDVEAAMLATIASVAPLAESLGDARREEPYYGASDLPNYVRRPYGAGWALVGDAGCHKDPLMALGVTDALRDAELLAGALDEGLAGRQPLEDALRGYERRRDEATLELFRVNLARAQLPPPPAALLQLRAALRGHPRETRHYLMEELGVVPRGTYFSPEHQAAILALASS